MNQVKARMNATAGMSIEFPEGTDPVDVTPLVKAKLDEISLKLASQDTIIKVLQETIIDIKNKICDRNQASFWWKELDKMQKALEISNGRLP